MTNTPDSCDKMSSVHFSGTQEPFEEGEHAVTVTFSPRGGEQSIWTTAFRAVRGTDHGILPDGVEG